MERRKYDKEFKLQAIRLSEIKEKPIRELEKELGIGAGCISHWKAELDKEDKNAFPGNGNPKDREIYELKKKIAELEMEREILKKAISIFSEKKK